MSSSQVEERLQLYVDEKVEALRNEVLALIATSSGSTSSANKIATKDAGEGKAESEEPTKVTIEGNAEKEEPPVLVSEEHLDEHDSYALGASIWDAALFIGLGCVGPGESVVLLFLVFLNSFVQLYFCWIISFSSGMLEDPLDNKALDGLLHFRTSVAHNVGNADVASGRSLLSQVCSGATGLHVSGTQLDLNEDIESFMPGGPFLCMLALICWSASALAELNSTLKFTFSVLQRKGRSTRILVRGEGEMELESLSALDLTKVILLGSLPRLVNAVVLFYVGVLYLSKTSRLEDLLLNAMALAFVMEVDELFFAAFVPHRVRSLIAAVAPLHLEPHHMLRNQRWFQRFSRAVGGSFAVLLRLLVLAGVLIVVYYTKLVPFYGRLQQARDILCSGELDFVYSINPASGMVVAARSAPQDESWAAAECAVMQLAYPELRDEFGWSPPKQGCSGIPDLERLKDSVRSAPALLRPFAIDSLQDPEFYPSEFVYVNSLEKASPEQAALVALCQDQVSTSRNGSAIYLAALRDAVGDLLSNVSTCEDVKPVCLLYNMTRVRALCPVTCECNLWGFTAAGLFKTPHYGCPKPCEVEATVSEQRWTAAGVYPLECLDFTETRYFFPPGLDLPLSTLLATMDGDMDGNLSKTEVTLGFLRHTIGKKEWSDIHFFDLDDDGVLDASEQGYMNWVYQQVKALDKDSDDQLSVAEASAVFGSAFTDLDGDGFLAPAEMSGHPQGMDVVVATIPKRMTTQPMEGAAAFLAGAFEYLWSRPNFYQSSARKVKLLGEYTGLTQEQQDLVVNDLVTGVTFAHWIWGSWQLGDGIPHPRGLVWCEFIASWEITLLLGLSLCEPGEVSSVRTMCPQSCGCEARLKDCPSSCPSVHKPGGSDP